MRITLDVPKIIRGIIRSNCTGMKNLAINIIKFYQYVSRLVLGSGQLPLLVRSDCKFQPSCSDYAIGSIAKYGVLKGSTKSAVRILKCNPFSKGGVNNP